MLHNAVEEVVQHAVVLDTVFKDIAAILQIFSCLTVSYSFEDCLLVLFILVCGYCTAARFVAVR